VLFASVVLVLVSSLLLAGAGDARVGKRGVQRVGTLLVAPTGSDSNPCTISAPCLSFDRAYRRAAAGDTVMVASGDYPAQTINADNAKQAPPVVFEPIEGGTAVIHGGLTIHASNVTIAGTETSAALAAGARVGFDVRWNVLVASVSGATAQQDVVPTNVLIENVNARAGAITGSNNVTVRGGQFGPAVSCVSGDTCAADLNEGLAAEDLFVVRSRRDPDGTVLPAQDLTIDGVYFHDLTKVFDRCSTYAVSCRSHADCLQVYSFSRLTIENSRFEDCSDSDFFVKNDDGDWAPFSGLTIDNNDLGRPTYPNATYDGQLASGGAGGPCTGVVFRFNRVVGGNVTFTCSGNTPANVLVQGNVMPSPHFGGCGLALWRYNFLTATGAQPCSATDAVGQPRVFALSSRRAQAGASIRYVVVSASDATVRLSVYTRGRLLDRRDLAAPATRSGRPGTVRWRPPASGASARPKRKAPAPTRFCVRLATSSGFSSPSCAPIA
jgi:hypothetical protein